MASNALNAASSSAFTGGVGVSSVSEFALSLSVGCCAGGALWLLCPLCVLPLCAEATAHPKKNNPAKAPASIHFCHVRFISRLLFAPEIVARVPGLEFLQIVTSNALLLVVP